MRILNNTDNLYQYLIAQSGKSIRIVTAFAGGTENVLRKLVAQRNNVELLLGTINAFTSPRIIDYCKSNSNSNFRTFVDFRFQKSVHWKLYLISPSTVVIGSANFTETGLSLQRDTCILIVDHELHNRYGKLIDDLLKTPEIIEAKDSTEFKEQLETYSEIHKKIQRSMIRAKTATSLKAWLSDETNQHVPMLIWESNHSSETKVEADEILQEALTIDESKPALRDFFTYRAAKGKLPYSQGDVVLCASKRGGHISFFVFDRILYRNGCHFIYSYRQPNHPPPFATKPIQKKLKELIPRLFEEGAEYLERETLKTLL
jgi:hypothetical protein